MFLESSKQRALQYGRICRLLLSSEPQKNVRILGIEDEFKVVNVTIAHVLDVLNGVRTKQNVIFLKETREERERKGGS